MALFFTSDHHFGHANAIRYCARPFTDISEMDEAMITRWNERVKYGDTVYHLGDFTLGDDAEKYIRRLNGNIVFIAPPWHHDSRWLKKTGQAHTVYPAHTLKCHEVLLFMFHYPVAVWERKHYGSWHLFGHIHRPGFVLPGFALNVGVDHHEFYPVSFDFVWQYMTDLGWYPGWKSINT